MIEIIFASGIAVGTALLFPSLGELINQRAGVTNLGTEGGMLGGALAGVIAGLATGSAWWGLAAGALAGVAVAAIFAWAVVLRGGNQLASGLIVWFLMLGLTSVIGRDYVGQGVTSLSTMPIPVLAEIPFLGRVLFTHDPLVYGGFLAIPLLWWFLTRTRAGLKVRATGERPLVVDAAGHSAVRTQFTALLAGGALTGLGGAYLSVGQVGNWSTDMTNGYGFVAVAVVIFSAWRVGWTAGGAYLFGAMIATASVLQARGFAVNQHLLDALPYLVTLVVLVIISARRVQQPEALSAALSTR
ncbi:ABC transporter permease [Nesterenkonia populi]|uniref:ABC transporter permease n=1 Tax=Nesterenkonia populi TaxID=1591087 RepID=UPI0011BE22A9|nr:ABC transporter permease [Nesterenkonia populi]